MLVETVRSGLVESRHRVEVVAVGADGEVLAAWGGPERPYFARSAIKPIQTSVSARLGPSLTSQQLAVACASHVGEPVHLAVVRQMLAEVGLDESHLECPPDWPGHEAAARRLAAAGQREPLRVFHNCSGKHAAMLRACARQGWPTAGYSAPDHPLQQEIAAAVAAAVEDDVGPVGVDGCGVPSFRVTTTGLARAFAKVATDPALRHLAEAMHRYPALTSGTGRLEPRIALALHAAAKIGAEGCLGVALIGQMGLAAKADDGSKDAAVVGMIAALRALGLVPESARHDLLGAERVPVLGGGRRVGWMKATLPERR